MLFPIATLLSASVAIASPMAVGSPAHGLLELTKRQSVPSINESGIAASCLDVCKPGYDASLACYTTKSMSCFDLCKPDTLTNIIGPCVQCQLGETTDVAEKAIIEESFEMSKKECAYLLASMNPNDPVAVSATDLAWAAGASEAAASANAGLSAGAGVSDAAAAEPAVSGESAAASQVEGATAAATSATAATTPNISTKPSSAVAGSASSSAPITSATSGAFAVPVPFVAALVAAGIALAL